MVYLCKACFIRYTVTLQPSVQCGACTSQQHAEGLVPGALSDGPLCLPQKAPRDKACPSQTAKVVLLGRLPSVGRVASESRPGGNMATFLPGYPRDTEKQ